MFSTNGPRKPIIAAVLFAALFPLASAAQSDAAVHAWDRWEHTLVSDVEYANPYTDVQVRVRFEGPDSMSDDGLAFWDGGNRFLIRHAFPSPRDWRWSTTSSDPGNKGLHEQSGTVTVQPSRADSTLAKRGYLRVSDDGRLLVHADGTPFLWIGDTCWAAPVHATSDEWTRYVDNRAAKGYSVLQLSIAPDWALERSRNNSPPFLSTLPDITKPNPEFFQELDKKFAIANDRGLAIMLCGLMETPHRYPPPDQIAVLSRYVAARYRSFAVIFSPSFDSRIMEAETLASAAAIREAAPSNLVTMHMGTGVEPHFHSVDWLLFDMYQSGHNGGNAARQSARAIGMPADILALPGRKPIINGEAIYEGDLGGAYDVRRTAWLSFLSGAVGYTAGINQVYAWEEDAFSHIDVPSSDQVALLAGFLRSIPWWMLERATARIKNQPEDRSRLMAFALTADKSLGVAYLPANPEVILDLSECMPRYNVLWINPATGDYRDANSIESSASTSLKAPDKRDWVVVLAAETASLTPIADALNHARRLAPEPVASITFSKSASAESLVRKSPGDGEFVYSTFNGAECIVNERPNKNSYLYIDVDDRLAFRGGARAMVVEVKLHPSQSPDAFQLQYDADGPPDVPNVYRAIPPVEIVADGEWSVLQFRADAPFLGNRQNAGADFRIFLNGAKCHIHSLTVTLELSAG